MFLLFGYLHVVTVVFVERITEIIASKRFNTHKNDVSNGLVTHVVTCV